MTQQFILEARKQTRYATLSFRHGRAFSRAAKFAAVHAGA
jgi:hypothetical protein